MHAEGLCHWAERVGRELRVPTGDFSSARRWVAGLLADGAQVHALRARIAALPGIALANSNDHQLAEQLVHAIVFGHLRVCATGAPRKLMRLASQPAPAAAAASTAPATRRSAAAPASAASEPEIDAVAMAQVLREAAETGVPFCEECERARRQQAATA